MNDNNDNNSRRRLLLIVVGALLGWVLGKNLPQLIGPIPTLVIFTSMLGAGVLMWWRSDWFDSDYPNKP